MRRIWTLYLGLTLIVLCTLLVLAVDAPRRDFAIVPDVAVADLPPAQTPLQRLARWAAVNITGINWVGYLLVFDGLLSLVRARQSEGSPLRVRPNRFLVAWLTSIPVWCFFDWVNFYHMQAWDYHGLPPHFAQRLAGYFVAFAAISPGMFLAAELYQRLGVRRLACPVHQGPRLTGILSLGVILTLAAIIALIGVVQQRGPAFMLSTLILVVPGAFVGLVIRHLLATVFTFGLCFTAWAILIADPLGNMALWVGLIYLLDPINHRLGGPSILRDWQAGRLGRTASLMLGGATCGLLWEFWNYWALAKWTYNLPFLSGLEQFTYFEMPLLGFLGFLPFAVECWVMLNTIILGFERANLRLAEPLPDEQAVL